MERFDAIVIGAGEAGALVAGRAVAAGHRVAMIYREPYGSTCLNTGCIPSKFLIHRARVAHVVRTAGRFNVAAGPPRVDLAAMVREKRTLIDESRQHSLEHARAADGLTLIEGDARFVDPRTIEVRSRRLTANRIFIATGLRPALPDIPGLSPERVFTSESLMEQDAVPERLLVIGGGYVGCELGQAYRRFGAEVTLIQSKAHLLPREEPDVSTELERALASEGIELLLGARTVKVEHRSDLVRLTVSTADRATRIVEGSALLVATGRRPNTDSLDLEAAGVAVDAKGYVVVTDRLEASAPGIWAIGDVNGHQPFTRVCQEEATVAFANAFEEAGLSMERHSLGHAVFTDPEVGSVGLTLAEARGRGFDAVPATVPIEQVSRARLAGETTGIIKYVVDRSTRRVLGCHVVGPHAAELVYDAAIAIRHGRAIDEIATTVGVFPTLQEGMEGSARAMVRSLAQDAARNP